MNKRTIEHKKGVLYTIAFTIVLCIAICGSSINSHAQNTAAKSNDIFEIIAFSKDSVQLKTAAETKLYSVALISSNNTTFEGGSFSNSVDTVYWANGSRFWPGSSMGMPAAFGVGAMTLNKGAVLTISGFGTPDGFKPAKIKLITDGTTEMYYNVLKKAWEK